MRRTRGLAGAIALSLAASAPAFAEFGAFLQLYPAFAWTSEAPLADIAQAGPDDYRRYYAMPSPLVFGLDLSSGGLELVFRVDTRADFLAFQTEPYYTNVPFVRGGASAIDDVNMPTVAYIDYRADSLELSVGRRKLAWGPATYGLAISDGAAYLDHAWFDYRFPAGRGDFWFDYLLIGTDRPGEASIASAEANRKTVVAHRVGYEDDRLRIGVGELNLVYGVVPDLGDLAPLAAYHNLYDDAYSNVMMEISAEALLGAFRCYGEFVLDDFVMPWESSTSHPTALGWCYGAEWRPGGGIAFARPRTGDSDYELRDRNFAKAGGLSLSLEHYRTTAYLYNREKVGVAGASADLGKWVLPDQRIYDDGYLASSCAFYLGFPYGPDCCLDMLTARYEGRRFEASVALEYLRRGSYGIESAYSAADNVLDWYDLAPPVSRDFVAELSGEWALTPDLRACASCSLSAGDDAGASVTAGACYSLETRR